MTEVTLDVKGDGDLLKLDWRSPSAPGASYHTGINKLVVRGKVVRERLQDLITAAMDQRAAKQPLKLGFELKALAEAGSKLREAIFSAEAGTEENEGTEAETWLADLGEAVLHVWIDRRIYIPWGLAYDGDPPDIADPSEMDIGKFSGFWCVKYGLSTLYNRIRDSVVRNPRPTDQVQIVKLVNASAWTTAVSQIPLIEQMASDLIFKDAIYTSQDFKKTWQKNKKSLETDLLYFYGHASGTALEFGKEDLLTMQDFPDILKRNPRAERPACMVFLNGCHTAIGDDKEGGFLQATAYGGFCGFVGTEAKIPDVFALRFANAFITELLYTGTRAVDVMNKLRREHWPLSLVYNLSCHPEFRFDATGSKSPAIPPVPNLSEGVIGSQKM